jgi:DNA primase
VRGEVIAFGGRAIPPPPGAPVRPSPKYLNTPESPLFRKREAFYGLPFALESIRSSGRAIVVRGLLRPHRARSARVSSRRSRPAARRSRPSTPASSGGARARSCCSSTATPPDSARWSAALEVLLPEGLRVRAAALPPGDDPDSLPRARGCEALRALVDGAVPALEA